MKLDKQTRKKLKLYRTAQKIQRKLESKPFATRQQRDSWKRIMAKAYREFPTTEEALMRPLMEEIGFEPQYFVSGYIADFASEQHRVIVEIDGKIHDKQKVYDMYRDAVLATAGWRVIRFCERRS